ncbi:hypothetical protein ABIE27_000085 [Paenibacillus sp. 4624]
MNKKNSKGPSYSIALHIVYEQSHRQEKPCVSTD